MLYLILSALCKQEQHYATTIATDESIIQEDISDSYRSAVVYRLTHKNIIALNIVTIKYIMEWIRTLAGAQSDVDGQLLSDATLYPSTSEKLVLFSNLISVCRASDESDMFKYLEWLNNIEVV